MSHNTDDLPLASNFQPLEGEANFGPPITREVVGGAHIAPHCITVHDGKFILIDWEQGLLRHDPPGRRTVRFPHGLIKFGESFEGCAARLVREQLGMQVEVVNVVHVYSYVDEMTQWHMEPIMVMTVVGTPRMPNQTKAVYWPIGPSLPLGGVWSGKPPFEETFHKFIAQYIGVK